MEKIAEEMFEIQHSEISISLPAIGVLTYSVLLYCNYANLIRFAHIVIRDSSKIV